MNANLVCKSTRIGARTRVLLFAGTALPLALLTAPAQAACTVEGDTTTCTGDLSTGVGTNTPNVVVSDLTADITPAAGFSAIWMGDVANADIDTGDYTLNVQGAAAVGTDSANPVDLNFTGTINVTGLDPASNASSGIMAFAYQNGGSDVGVHSTGNITIDISQDSNSATWGNRAIVALAGVEEAAVTSTGDLSVTVAGEQETLVKGIEVSGEAGASIVNAGNVTVSAEGGYGDGLAVLSGAASSVESVGDINVDFGSTAGYGISAHGTHNTISSQGNITADGGGIVAQGKLVYDQNGDIIGTNAAAITEITSSGDITVSEDGAGAIVALGNDVTVSSTGALTTAGDLSSGIIAMRDYGVDENTGEVYFDDSAQSVSVISEGDITTAGDGSLGIAAGAGAGTATVTSVGDITTAGEFGIGIGAAGQAVTINSDGSITTDGAYSHGIIVAGDFAMVGEDPEAMAAAAGDITISAGDVSTSGMAAMGIRAFSSDGAVEITANSVATSGAVDEDGNVAEAVFAQSINGTASVDVASASAEGFAASAVLALGGAGAHITVETASIAGQYSAALYANSAQGAASIDAGSVTLRGDQQAAVNAVAEDGAATVTVDSIVGEGTLGSGVFAKGAGGVSVTSGTIAVQGNGISAFGLDDSDVTIVTTGDTTTETGHAIAGSGANVAVTTAEGAITRGASGIVVNATGSATIVNGGTAVATADLGNAIHVTAPGAVSIVSEAVEVTGAGAWPGLRGDGSNLRLEQGGIIVEGGAGAIAIDAGTVDIEGEHRYGISARGTGAISIAVDSVNLASPDASAVAARGTDGAVSIVTGTIVTTGASGTGIVAETTSGNITVDAGTTRIEGEGMAGPFTGEGIYAHSGTGSVIVNAADTFNAAYAGSAVVASSGGNVTVDSGIAETTGDDGVALLAQSSNGTLTFASDSVTTTGANTRAIAAHAFNGQANVTVGDVTALGTNASGVLSSGREVNLVVNGTVQSTQVAVNVAAQGGLADVLVNGSITSTASVGLVNGAQDGVVTIAEGASVSGATSGVALLGGLQGGFTQFYNSGTVTGASGSAVAGLQTDPNAPVPSFYIQNNGTLVAGESGVAVATGAGDDTLELTNLSVIDGIADLGEGDDRLTLDFNDDAPANAVGQVVSTINVEGLSVDSGSWRAEGVQSQYQFVEIEEGATLTVVENEDGALAIESGLVELDGALRLDLSVDETEGDLGETTIAGAGSLHLVGTATVALTDATGLQHTGGTFVENGELLLETVYGGDITTSGQGVFELGAAGDFTGNLVNNGTFVFSRDTDYSFVGDFSGNGLLQKGGDSTLTFAGLYNFLGTTSVFGGSVTFTGQLAEDTELDLTDGTVDLSQVDGGEQTIGELQGTGGTLQLGETQLVINQLGDTVFSGEILGLGSLIKEGEGDLKLNGDGTGFTGTGQVGGGTLSVNGNFGNANFEVNAGGTLGGAGTVGGTNVNGGTLAPGNSIDTLTVNGNATFTAASVYEVEVDAAGNSDLLQVTGNATLGGARVNVIAENGTYRAFTDYTILTADDGISGTFASVQDNLAFLDPSLSYSANAVTLRLVRNDIDFAAFGGTGNQAVIGGLIESFGFGNALYDATLTLADSNVAVSFASLTGEVYPAYGAALVETAEILRRQTADAAHGEGAYAWATGLYNGVDSGSGAGNIELLGKGAAGGFGFGGSGFTAMAGVGKLDQDRGGSQFSDGDVTFAIGRLGWSGLSGLSASAGAQFGWTDAETRRQTRLGAIDQAVSGAIEGDYVQLFGELGYRLPVGGGFTAEPFVGVSHVSLDLDVVTETGAPTALAIAAIDRDVTFANLGLRVSGDAGAGVRPFASAAYRHAWGDRASVASFGFAGLAGTGLVGAVPIAKSAAELSGGVAVTRGMIDFEVGYDATISKGFDSHGVSAGFKLRF